MDSNIRNSESLALFKKRILAFIKPPANSAFHCHSPDNLTLITSLRLGLSHLRFHKFKHSFQDALNPIWNCCTVETTIHYLLHYPNFSNERLKLFNKLQSIDENVLSKDDCNISKVLLFNCVNWIYNFNRTFWCFLISKLTPIYLSICSLFLVFIKELLYHFCYLVLNFL